MDARQIKLDCEQNSHGQWRVYCVNTGAVLSESQRDPESAWASAADKLAEVLSEIRLTACID